MQEVGLEGLCVPPVREAGLRVPAPEGKQGWKGRAEESRRVPTARPVGLSFNPLQEQGFCSESDGKKEGGNKPPTPGYE